MDIETKLYVQAELMARDTSGSKKEKEGRNEVIALLRDTAFTLESAKERVEGWEAYAKEFRVKHDSMEVKAGWFLAWGILSTVALIIVSIHLFFG